MVPIERTTSVQRMGLLLQRAGVSPVLREAFFGVRRFSDFQGNLGISRSVLTRTLKTLVEQGIFRRVRYQQRPERFEYHLTESGLALYPVFLAMKTWADAWLGGDGPVVTLHHEPCDHDCRPVMTCDHCHEAVVARQMSYRVES